MAGSATITKGDCRVEAATLPKLLHADPSRAMLDAVPALGLDAVKRYTLLTGSAQCGDHPQNRSGGGSPGRKLTVRVTAWPFPLTLVGRVPPDVAIVPVTEMVALQTCPATAGIVGTSKMKLPNAPRTCGVPKVMAHPVDAAAGATPPRLNVAVRKVRVPATMAIATATLAIWRRVPPLLRPLAYRRVFSQGGGISRVNAKPAQCHSQHPVAERGDPE